MQFELLHISRVYEIVLVPSSQLNHSYLAQRRLCPPSPDVDMSKRAIVPHHTNSSETMPGLPPQQLRIAARKGPGTSFRSSIRRRLNLVFFGVPDARTTLAYWTTMSSPPVGESHSRHQTLRQQVEHDISNAKQDLIFVSTSSMSPIPSASSNVFYYDPKYEVTLDGLTRTLKVKHFERAPFTRTISLDNLLFIRPARDV
jgi:hypothetical protein